MLKRFLLTLALAFLYHPTTLQGDEPDPKGGPPVFKHLKFRSIGPAAGGRVSRSAGIPGNPWTYYVATASGGVWLTTNGGITWHPMFDDQPISSIGAIAVARSDPNVIYVGSGEANIRGNVAPGNGIYKSTDAGKTWKHVWKQEGQIGQMIVHPTNPDLAYAAVLGHAFGPNPERGVYRTTDGGKSWQQVLARDPDTGAIDVCFDPNNPRILFAALWQARRKPWEFTSGGPGSGLYTSRDGGDTWKQLTGKGLPDGIWGRIGLAVAPSDSRRVYALIEAEKGGLYRSDDRGEKWKLVNAERYLQQRPWYFSTLTVDPSNADVVWAPTVRLLKSIDGGKTFRQVRGPHHVDHHDLWIDPTNPQRMIDSNDGGVDITINGGETWYAPPLPVCQFYHVGVDNRKPYHVCGAMQDIGTAAGPSNSLSTDGITLDDWYDVGGGEAGYVVPDPSDPNIVYAGEYGGYMSRYDYKNRQVRNMSIYPTNPSGSGAEALRYRFQWTAPIMVSPHDSKVLYHAANVLLKSTDGGMHWTPVSPDLTRNDKAKQQWSGGPITGDNTGVEYYCTIFALAESLKQKNLLWVGSDDGLVHVSTDSGKNWTNVTRNIPGMPEWGTVCCIEPSRFDAATAYLVVDAHRLDNMRPYLYRTRDLCKTWEKLSAGLPQDIYLHVVREDARQKGLLYAGTERGVIFSTDDGASWQELKLNLPTVAVHDLAVKDNDLVVGTHGRSIWVLDDLTPIRDMTPRIAEQAVHLFPLQPAIRWHYHERVGPPSTKQAGENPPRGAVINYYLKEKPRESITLQIQDADGSTVKLLDSLPEVEEVPEDDPDERPKRPKKIVLPVEPGVNRVVWDLHYTGATIIPRGKTDGGDARIGPMVNPGAYTIKLTVDGKAFTAKLEVQPDLRLETAPAHLEEQLKLALELRDDITRLSDMVAQIRSLKGQLLARNELLKNQPRAQPLIKSAQHVIAKLDALEARLHNPRAKVSYDILAQRGGAQLYSKLTQLYDWVRSGEGAPTQGMEEVHVELSQDLKKLTAEFQDLVRGDLADLSETAGKLDIPDIIVPQREKASKKQ